MRKPSRHRITSDASYGNITRRLIQASNGFLRNDGSTNEPGHVTACKPCQSRLVWKLIWTTSSCCSETPYGTSVVLKHIYIYIIYIYIYKWSSLCTAWPCALTLKSASPAESVSWIAGIPGLGNPRSNTHKKRWGVQPGSLKMSVFFLAFPYGHQEISSKGGGHPNCLPFQISPIHRF